MKSKVGEEIMDYTKIKELKLETDLNTINSMLEKKWLLVSVTTKNKETAFLLGRID